MTYPRSVLVDRENGGFYLVTTRCVRRAWLCGIDPLTGKSYEHRRGWIEDRILMLAKRFAVQVYGYAVMSNHYHGVLYVDPQRPNHWSDREVARRWVTITPSMRHGEIDSTRTKARIEALLGDKARLADCRQRLGDLSWFMRYLNEGIARRANREDGCTGRFWEGRFDSRALLDARAVYGSMAYVDLNPIRAGMTTQLEESHHTSVKRRIDIIKRKGGAVLRHDASADESPLLAPLSGFALAPEPRLDMTVSEYLTLVDWTGRRLRPDKRGAIPTDAPSVLTRVAEGPDAWLETIAACESPRRRAGCTDIGMCN